MSESGQAFGGAMPETGISFGPNARVVLKGKTETVEMWQPLHDGATEEAFLDCYCAAYEALTAMMRGQAR